MGLSCVARPFVRRAQSVSPSFIITRAIGEQSRMDEVAWVQKAQRTVTLTASSAGNRCKKWLRLKSVATHVATFVHCGRRFFFSELSSLYPKPKCFAFRSACPFSRCYCSTRKAATRGNFVCAKSLSIAGLTVHLRLFVIPF